jgi:copper(I)-binding protein
MKRRVPILSALITLSGCGAASEEPRASVENAVVTLPAVPGRPGAAYFTLRGNRPARLTAISSAQIGRIELHQTMNMAGMSRMAPLEAVPIGPEAPTVFEPGGRHAMLFDIAPAVQAGGRVRLTFTVDPLPPVTVEAEVRGPGDAHAGH